MGFTCVIPRLELGANATFLALRRGLLPSSRCPTNRCTQPRVANWTKAPREEDEARTP